MTPRAAASLLLYYAYCGLLAVSFLFMSASGLLGREDHMALRFIVTAAGLFGVYCAVKLGKPLWVLILAAMIAVFNPVWHPGGLPMGTWMTLDLVAAGAFIASFLGLRPKSSR